MNATLPKTVIATTPAEIRFFSLTEAEQLAVLESSLYPGAKPESIKLVIANCRAQVLDPMTKPFHIVPMSVKQRKRDRDGNLTNATEYIWRDVVMPGIELYRTKAARTGAYAGIDQAQWGKDITETFGGEDKLEWDDEARRKIPKGKFETVNITYPEWCEVTVYRIVHGVRCAFTSGRVYWKEAYATAGRETTLPNEMWRKRTRGQLEKCAEALALRRAFPEIGAMPTADEMIGKVLDLDAESGLVVEATDADRKVEQPRAKSTKSAHAFHDQDRVLSTADNETASVADASQKSTPAAASRPAAPPSAGTGGGAALDPQPIKPSQLRIIQAKLANNALTELDLEAAFPGRSLEPKSGKTQFTFGEFGMLVEWIGKNSRA